MIPTVNSDTLRLTLQHTPGPDRRLALSVLARRVHQYHVISMTSTPSLARLASRTRYAFHVLKIVLVLALAFPVGVIAALLRIPFLLAPAIPDCLRLMVILPIAIPLLTVGSTTFGIYWVVKKALGVLSTQLALLSSGRRTSGPPTPTVAIMPSADLESILAKEPLPVAGSPLPRTPLRIDIPAESAYPSPPLTESSRNSSICFESPGLLTPGPDSSLGHADYFPAVVAAQLQSATQKLSSNYVENGARLVVRLPDSSVPASQYISDAVAKSRSASRVRTVRFHLHDDDAAPHVDTAA
ncbi:hypothetical protein AURDEDRAFT_109703 [Auricularia subglabra TFB-10046 SS5]|nr:hypothetical protein AURDEDRAFT_109703 [Auricularia subglabra TFB-10046 SS5]